MDPIKAKINEWLNDQPEEVKKSKRFSLMREPSSGDISLVRHNDGSVLQVDKQSIEEVVDADDEVFETWADSLQENFTTEDVMMPVTKTSYGEMVNNMIRAGKIRVDKDKFLHVYTSDNDKLTLEIDGNLKSNDEALIKAVAKGWTLRVITDHGIKYSTDSPMRDLYNHVRQRLRVDTAISGFYKRIRDESDRKMSYDRERLSASVTEAFLITVRNTSDGIKIDTCNSIKEAAGSAMTIHVAGTKSWIAGTKNFVPTDKILETIKTVLNTKYDKRINETINVHISDFHDELKNVSFEDSAIMEWTLDNFDIGDGYVDPVNDVIALDLIEMKRFEKFCDDTGITIKK